MKKNLILALCLVLIIILFSITSNDKIKDQKNVSQTASDQSTAKITNDTDNVSEEITKVNSKVKLYEGTYFDDKCYGENQLTNYCEVEISNVTNTSFDFTVYEVNVLDGKRDKKVIFAKNTAFFIENEMKAAFKGKKYSLKFTFINDHNAFPVVTDITVSGFKQLEGKTFVNNKIPGHEFG